MFGLKQKIQLASPFALRRLWKERVTIQQWEKAGRPAPPPAAVKQRVIRDFAQRFELRTLVETGTYMGDTVAACRPWFDTIYSIELSVNLHAAAQKRFHGDQGVRLLQGDSGEVLPRVLDELTEPTLFWLDGHYSAGVTARGDKDTPVCQEVEAILQHRIAGHVVLIDDARLFTGRDDYPTVQQLQNQVRRRRTDLMLSVSDDIIRIGRAA